MSKDSKKQLPQVTDPSLFKKSNELISAQFKWGGFATSILNLALTKMIKGEATEDEYGIPRILSIHMYEMPGFKSGSSNTYIYKKVDKASDELQNAKINIQYKDQHGNSSFEKIVVFPYAHYENGVLTLAFSPEIISRKLANPLENYTKVLLTSELFGNSEVATKLYENLKKYCFYAHRVGDHYEWLVSVSTLRCILGVVDTNQKEFLTAMDKLKDKYNVDDVVRELEEKDRKLLQKRQEEENARYGEMARKVKLRKEEIKAPYPDYRDFRKCVLEPALKVINEKSDIKASFEPTNLTGGGKVNALRFSIYKQIQGKELPYEEKRKKIIEVDKVLAGEDMQEWTTDMIGDLLELADYDAELVKSKYSLLRSQKPDSVKNRYAWLKSAISDNYQSNYVDEPKEEHTPFERLWNEYPKKSRLDKLTKKQRDKIDNEIGYDVIHNAIVNYMAFIDEQRKNGFNRSYLGGGIFFSGEYERWTDENIAQTRSEEGTTKKNNKFVNFEQRDIDYDAIAQQKVMDRMKGEDNG